MAIKEENTVVVKRFYNSVNLPPRPKFCSKKPSKVQESPYDAKSPQEVLQQHGMYKDNNSIMERPEAFYADLTKLGNYEDCLNSMRDINDKFNQLDIDIRAKFNHNPDEFCRYVSSKGFEFESLLTDSQLKDYREHKKEVEQRKEYDNYIKSDKYKQDLEESVLRNKYEEEKYNEWKKSLKPIN
jgi:hypothetical protein